MPLYEYECFLCHHRFERIQRASADPIEVCPACGGAVRRLLGAPALQFKGSGWYVTDYGDGRSRITTETPTSGPATSDAGGSSEDAGSPAGATTERSKSSD